MGSARKFITSVSWRSVLDQLGVNAGAGILPTISTCPLCRNETLTIYDDSHTGSVWLWCQSCQFAGDVVNCAAACWKTDAHQAIGLLRGLGACDRGAANPDAADAYLRTIHTPRAKWQKAWDEAPAPDCASGPIREWLVSLDCAQRRCVQP